MERLIAENSVPFASADTAPATGTPQYATSGNPATGVAATIFPAYAWNMAQDEIMNVVLAAGLTPNGEAWNQLLTAIQTLLQGSAGNVGVDTGAANAYVVAFTPALTAPVPWVPFWFKVAHTNTGASTLNATGTAEPLVGAAHAVLQGNELVVNGNALVYWNPTLASGAGSYVLLFCSGASEQIAPATQSEHAVQLGQIPSVFRNRIINGAFQVDQRNKGAAQTITAAAALAYTVDRFYAFCTGANLTGQQVTGSGQDEYAYKFTGATGVTALTFGQRIKSANSYDMAGAAASLQAKLSSSTITTVTWTAYYANTTDTFGSVASPSKTQFATGTFTINATPTVYSAQIAVPGAATTGIAIEFSVGAFASGTLQYENVQFEAATASTPFERPPIELVTLMCQHYLPAFNSSSTSDTWAIGQVVNGVAAEICMPFKIQPRVPPTGITAVGVASTYYSLNNSAGTQVGANAVTFANAGLIQAFLTVTVPSGLTAGCATLFTALTTTAQILFNGCEL